MEVTSRSVNDENALFDDDGDDEEQIMVNRTGGAQGEKETSKQRLLSMAKLAPKFEGLRTTPAGHRIQDIKELMSVPVGNFRVRLYIRLTLCRSLSPQISQRALRSSRFMHATLTQRRILAESRWSTLFLTLAPAVANNVLRCRIRTLMTSLECEEFYTKFSCCTT